MTTILPGSVPQLSPIVEAIRVAESGTTAEIRVHLSRRLIERDPLKRAMSLFDQYEMSRTSRRNSLLIYVNLNRRRFAILADRAAYKTLGRSFWEEAARNLKRDFVSTHPENAIALSVIKIGERLARQYPKESP
jgi:uncharacterized membrane protein